MYNKSQMYAAYISILCIIFFVPSIFLDTSHKLYFKDYLKLVFSLIIGSITTYIAYQNHKISKEKKKIEEDKHKLELFDKRFEVYKLFLNMAVWSHKVILYKTCDINDENEKWKQSEEQRNKIKENIDLMVSLGEQSRFLFGDDVYKALSQARQDIFTLDQQVTYIRSEKHKQSTSTSFIHDMKSDQLETIAPARENCIASQRRLSEFYTEKLPEIMRPYLKISSYKQGNETTSI